MPSRLTSGPENRRRDSANGKPPSRTTMELLGFQGSVASRTLRLAGFSPATNSEPHPAALSLDLTLPLFPSTFFLTLLPTLTSLSSHAHCHIQRIFSSVPISSASACVLRLVVYFVLSSSNTQTFPGHPSSNELFKTSPQFSRSALVCSFIR